MITTLLRHKFPSQNEVFDSFVRVRAINLVPSIFPPSRAETPCTSPINIPEDVGASTSKSSAEFELKVPLPSPTTGRARELKRGECRR